MTRLLFWDNLVFDGVLSLNGVSVCLCASFVGGPAYSTKASSPACIYPIGLNMMYLQYAHVEMPTRVKLALNMNCFAAT